MNRTTSDTYIHEEDRYYYYYDRRFTQRYNCGGTLALNYYGPSRKTKNDIDDVDNHNNKEIVKYDEAYSRTKYICDDDRKMFAMNVTLTHVKQIIMIMIVKCGVTHVLKVILSNMVITMH